MIGPTGATGSQGPPGVNLFAISDAAGNVTGSGVTTSKHTAGTGVYQITFNRDLTSCAKVASTGDLGTTTGSGNLVRTGVAAGTAGKGVEIHIYTTKPLAPVDDSFHLIVVC